MYSLALLFAIHIIHIHLQFTIKEVGVTNVVDSMQSVWI